MSSPTRQVVMIGMTLLGALFTLIHSSDAGVDDLVTSALIGAAQQREALQGKESFDFASIIITNADCEPRSALAAYQKTVQFLSMPTQVAISSSRVWIHFPWIWRMDSEAVEELPCLRGYLAQESVEGNDLFRETLEKADNVKIVATGPMTSIADVLRSCPELIGKISELHWMGGAIDFPGNIIGSPEIPKSIMNDKAEWNVFCDAYSADWIFRNTSFPIYLYPLDISDSTIPRDFLHILGEGKSTLYSQYVRDCYKLIESGPDYRMWDVVAVAGLFFPEVLEPAVRERLAVVVTGKDHGAIVREGSGREVFVYKAFRQGDTQGFYRSVANILSDPLLPRSQ